MFQEFSLIEFVVNREIRADSLSSLAQDFCQRGDGGGQLSPGNRQRRRKADDVRMFALGQNNKSAFQHGLDDLKRQPGGGRTVRVANFQPSEQPESARREQNARAFCAQLGKQVEEKPTQRGTAPDKLESLDFIDLCESHRAPHRMTEKGAGVDRFTG
jgi:hypothetical protein